MLHKVFVIIFVSILYQLLDLITLLGVNLKFLSNNNGEQAKMLVIWFQLL